MSTDQKGCMDRNECLDLPCLNGASCINLEPKLRYRCVCLDGFWGDNCESIQEGQTLKLSMGALAAILVCLLVILGESLSPLPYPRTSLSCCSSKEKKSIFTRNKCKYKAHTIYMPHNTIQIIAILYQHFFFCSHVSHKFTSYKSMLYCIQYILCHKAHFLFCLLFLLLVRMFALFMQCLCSFVSLSIRKSSTLVMLSRCYFAWTIPL